jgi:alkylation response protein AidB-like acyl-CoA dehydrogenase
MRMIRKSIIKRNTGKDNSNELFPFSRTSNGAKMVRDFAQREITPIIKEHERRQELIPFALKRMEDLGILSICFPVRYDGAGMDYISWGLAGEEAVDTSLCVAMLVHTGCVR